MPKVKHLLSRGEITRIRTVFPGSRLHHRRCPAACLCVVCLVPFASCEPAQLLRIFTSDNHKNENFNSARGDEGENPLSLSLTPSTHTRFSTASCVCRLIFLAVYLHTHTCTHTHGRLLILSRMLVLADVCGMILGAAATNFTSTGSLWFSETRIPSRPIGA